MAAEHVRRQFYQLKSLLSKRRFAKIVQRPKSRIYLMPIEPKSDMDSKKKEKLNLDPKDDELLKLLYKLLDVFRMTYQKDYYPKDTQKQKLQ